MSVDHEPNHVRTLVLRRATLMDAEPNRPLGREIGGIYAACAWQVFSLRMVSCRPTLRKMLRWVNNRMLITQSNDQY